MIPILAVVFLLLLTSVAFFIVLGGKKRNNVKAKYQRYLSQFKPIADNQKMPIIYTKIAGTRYKNDDGSERQTYIGEAEVGENLMLVPQLDNPFDEDAVRVLRLNGQQLGFLDTDLAMEIKSRLVKRIRVDAQIVQISGDGLKEVQISLQRYSRK